MREVQWSPTNTQDCARNYALYNFRTREEVEMFTYTIQNHLNVAVQNSKTVLVRDGIKQSIPETQS